MNKETGESGKENFETENLQWVRGQIYQYERHHVVLYIFQYPPFM